MQTFQAGMKTWYSSLERQQKSSTRRVTKKRTKAENKRRTTIQRIPTKR
jgi:hypothetical protein